MNASGYARARFLAVLLLAAPGQPLAAQASAPPELRVTFLDVGQGDGIVVRSPEGRTLLVDAGRRDIVPKLRRLGVTQIDLVVATHPHADHIGGMRGVVESFPIRYYMDNGDAHVTATYRRLMEAVEARPEITYLEATPRTIRLGSLSVEVLPLPPPGGASLNDRSVPLVLRYGDFWAFMSGDSEVGQLSGLVGAGAVPDVTLLKAAHHGAANGYTPGFLQAASPELVVISVGENSYGHPAASALAAYRLAGARVVRTDWAGDVTVLARADGSYRVLAGSKGGLAELGEAALPAAPAAPGLDSSLALYVHADAPGDDHRNPNGEFAVVANSGASAVALGGWRLCDEANHCFRFPEGAEVAGGARVTVYSGRGLATAGRFYMGRSRAVWNNGGDRATLYDAGGAAVAVFAY